ncbi:MAG: ATP-binding protein [Lachnospiraceae bacterium]|nr:ATP-binding protein [Lachnospiraceae bacterium]
MERNAFLIHKKIHQYILPGVLMTVAMQLGNVVDGMIVGNFLGPDAMAAIELSMPVLLLLQMPALTLAMGGAAEAAVLLGKRKLEEAGGIFTASLAAGAVLSCLFALLTPFLPGRLAYALAGNEQMAALVEPYIAVNFGGIPVLTIAIIFCYFMNSDNHPQLGSALFMIANGVNLALDILFLKVFHMGMAGSALSTVTGYLAGMVTVIFYFRSKNRMLKLSWGAKGIVGRKGTEEKGEKSSLLHFVKAAVAAGIPSAAFTLMSALKSVIINSAIVRFLGNDSMAVYSVCANAVLIAELCVGGVIGLIPNIAGILYGERDYYGIRALCKRVLVYSYLTIGVLMLLFLVFPQWIAGLFGITDGEMLGMCRSALRIFAFGFPFYVYNKFLMSYYQTILQPGLSTMITVLQGFGVVVPLTLAGIFWMGILGVCAAAAVSEALTIVLGILYRIRGQRTGKFPSGGRYMLPKVKEEICLDFSIRNHLEDVIKLRDALFLFCGKNHIREKDTKLIGLALEEICANIVRYGYRGDKKNFIDISFTIQDGSYILRVRDDGIPFNPLEYQADEKENGGIALGGIALIRKIMSDFQYMRVLNMNNTVMELKIERILGG